MTKFEVVEIPTSGGRGRPLDGTTGEILATMEKNMGKAVRLQVSKADGERINVALSTWMRRNKPTHRVQRRCLPDGVYLWMSERKGESQ